MKIIIRQIYLFFFFFLVGCEISSETDPSVPLPPKILEIQNIESSQSRYRKTLEKIQRERDEEILRNRQENLRNRQEKSQNNVYIFSSPEGERDHHKRERKSVQNELEKFLVFP